MLFTLIITTCLQFNDQCYDSTQIDLTGPECLKQAEIYYNQKSVNDVVCQIQPKRSDEKSK